MNGGLDIPNLRKTLNKKPKSLLFARLADELRQSSIGEEGLNEALQIADKGLELNPDFLQGRLVRGRILLEKGDLTGAKMDLEFVAEKDPFCMSAQKMLLETFAKLGESPQTEVYQKILSCIEPDIIIDSKVLESFEKAKTGRIDISKITAKVEKPKTQAMPKADMSAALDSILEEDGDAETELKGSLSKAFDNIFEKPTSKLPATSPDSIIEKTKEPEPQLTPYKPPSPPPSPPPAAQPPAELPSAAPLNLDDLLSEQLSSKIDDSELPDLAGDLDALLAPSKSSEAPATPNVDDILNEQLASKIDISQLPDLTKDMDSLLSPAAVAASAAPVAPNLDDILSEQLASKIDTSQLPDLTKDMNSLLEQTSLAKTDVAPLELETHSFIEQTSLAGSAPNLDDILNEQLASKIDTSQLPDLTKDMDSLLAPAPVAAPNLDDILNEQLASKIDTSQLPDLTKDMDSLLAPAAAPASSPAAPNLDDILNEQLASKIDAKELPDFMGDMDSLLSSATKKAEPAAPNIDDILNEQLASKIDPKEMPDFMGDMDSLLSAAPKDAPEEDEPELMPYVPPSKTRAEEDVFAQNPTPTLASLYLNQGLAQKAADMYTALLAKDPTNAEFQDKLAQAKALLNAK